MTDILAGQIGNTFNVHSKSRDERARLLSNFANRPFRIGGDMFASVEGFIQGIKFPQKLMEVDDLRYRAFASTGNYAKSWAKLTLYRYVWWNGGELEYGSDAHHQLIESAIRAKFEQNPDCMEALLSTSEFALTHDTGGPESPDTSLPAKLFCEILTKIRDENS